MQCPHSAKVFQSCMTRNNRVGVAEYEETAACQLVRQPVVTDAMVEAKGGMTFNVTFGASEKPGPPPTRVVNGQKEENFEKWRATQEQNQVQKQKRAHDNREQEKVQKQIETAHKEMERLAKYVNVQDDE